MLVEGRACLLTGAGRGIGAATARLLAENGASLALCSLSDSAAMLAEELAERACVSG